MATSFISADRWLESMLSWQPTTTSATTDQQKSDQDTLVSRSRDAWRNQLIAKAIIERLAMNVIGSGLVCKPKIPGNKTFETEVAVRFNKWVKNCEYEETQNFYAIQNLVFSSRCLSGDVFVNTVVDDKNQLKLQVIEADRISNPGMSPDTRDKVQGVFLNHGKPYAYSVQSTHPGDVYPEYIWTTFSKYGSISGKQRFFHIWRKERPGQVRGIPLLATVLEALRKMDRYMDAELTGAVISSLFSVFVKSEGGMTLPGYTDSTEKQAENETKQDRIYMKPGMVVNLAPGEDISLANPTRPNANYEPFVNSIIRQIAASVCIPFDVLMLQFNDSYSASRAALMQFWKTVMRYRWELIEQFCQPIYELWLENEILSGRIMANPNDDIYEASWVGPAKGSIDDTKEVIAARERINLGVSDIQTETEEIGGRDWLEVHEQRKLEHEMRIAADLEKENNQPEPIQTPLTTEGQKGQIGGQNNEPSL